MWQQRAGCVWLQRCVYESAKSIRACIKNGKCVTTEVVAASTPAPVSRGSRNRYAYGDATAVSSGA